jgi:hypothetical protein
MSNPLKVEVEQKPIRYIQYTVDPLPGRLASANCYLTDMRVGFGLAQLRDYCHNWTDDGNWEIAIWFIERVISYAKQHPGETMPRLPELAKRFGLNPFSE